MSENKTFKKIIDYNTLMDLMNYLRSSMKLKYTIEDYDTMLVNWQRTMDYINSAPIEKTGASLPIISARNI